ncbi:hypothetical protein [Anaeromyxobacter terrae]|uniref:hypothetical protein n=1 Tax=Anaeromyxobacter terrae TaxID=2925406 RepID=UPI001F56E9B9|nr:hypothetical protein [Anaeromyxobacter sp. SG22]
MRRFAVISGLLAVFILGVVVGAGIFSVLSSRASRLFVSMTRFGFESEQADRLRAALSAGNLDRALVHASCALEGGSGLLAFDPDKSVWGPSFPVFGAFVTGSTRFGATDERQYLARMHARLGVVLERRGNENEARIEYKKAVEISGAHDEAWWRRVALGSLGEQASSGQ